MSKIRRGCNVDGHYLEFKRIWGARGVLQGWACNCETYARQLTCKHAEKAAALFSAKRESTPYRASGTHG